jgi:hypothetical protein
MPLTIDGGVEKQVAPAWSFFGCAGLLALGMRANATGSQAEKSTKVDYRERKYLCDCDCDCDCDRDHMYNQTRTFRFRLRGGGGGGQERNAMQASNSGSGRTCLASWKMKKIKNKK